MMDAKITRAVEDFVGAGYPRDAEAVLLVELDGLAAGVAEQTDAVREIAQRARRGVGPSRGGRRRTRAALEGTQVCVRRDRPHRARLLPARRGRAAHASSSRCCGGSTRSPTITALVTMNVFHAGDGNLHPLIVFDGREPGVWERVHRCRHRDPRDVHRRGRCAHRRTRRRHREARPHAVAVLARRSRRPSAAPRRVRSRRRGQPAQGAAARQPLRRVATGAGGHVDLSALCAAVADAPAVVAVGAQTQWEVGAPVRRRGGSARAGGSRRVRTRGHDHHGRRRYLRRRDRAPSSVRTGRSAHSTRATTGATVGGALAAGLSGVRRLRHGPIRDQVLEVRFVTGDGRVVKGGGPTVKNVTGYDLPRLMVGSFGTLGVLAQVTLRCRPRAAGREVVRGAEPPRHVYRPAAMLWNEAGVFVPRRGQCDRRRRTGRGPRPRRNAPALPEGAHRGRISVAPGAIARARRRSLVGRCALVRRARRRHHPRRRRLRRRAATARATPRTRTAAGCSAKPAATAWTRSAASSRTAALMPRIKTAFDPTGKLAPGRLPL